MLMVCVFSDLKPRSVSGAQCGDVAWTHNNFSFSSAAIAMNQAMTLHQQDSTKFVRETQSRDLATEGQNANAQVLIYKMFLL